MELAFAGSKQEAEDLRPQRGQPFVSARPIPRVTPQGWGWSGLEAAEAKRITALPTGLTHSSRHCLPFSGSSLAGGAGPFLFLEEARTVTLWDGIPGVWQR